MSSLKPVAWVPMSDVQWMNIVNHDRAWSDYTKDEAIHEAVKMTEAKCKENNIATIEQPVQERDDKEVALKDAVTLYQHFQQQLAAMTAELDELRKRGV